MGARRTEGSSAVEDGGQAAISPMPDVDETLVHVFEISKLEGLYAGDLLYLLNNSSPFSSPTQVLSVFMTLITHMGEIIQYLFFHD